MQFAAICLIGLGLYLMYCGVDSVKPWESVVASLSAKPPKLTAVKDD